MNVVDFFYIYVVDEVVVHHKCNFMGWKILLSNFVLTIVIVPVCFMHLAVATYYTMCLLICFYVDIELCECMYPRMSVRATSTLSWISFGTALLLQVKEFKYLGVLFTSEGRDTQKTSLMSSHV